jgi:hypothetical protein
MSALVRLRPVVHASPTDSGLHVRGRASSFTLDGGAGLWQVWQRLARPLAEGIPAASLTPPANTTPVVAAALEAILGQLREHDMVVEVPAHWGSSPLHGWLESVAADPHAAWQRLSGRTFTISGDPALTAAARSSTESAGLRIEVLDSDHSGVVVAAGGFAVAAGCAADVGWVVPPGTPAAVRADFDAVAARLEGSVGPAPVVLSTLVASTAVHRLLCAVAGLPDPSAEDDSAVPKVLVARRNPLRATYHPWFSSTPVTVDPIAAMDILTDAELGPLPMPVPADLPQVPARLARCGDVVGVGATADAALLDATTGALATPGSAVGIGETQALGSALRAMVRDMPGTDVSAAEWAGDPEARRWWKALTVRFGVPATIDVRRLAPGVVRAVIRSSQGLLAWAVEATAADAVAFAALAATGHVQSGAADGVRHLNAALAASLVDDREWRWPARAAKNEPELQGDLVALAGREPERVPAVFDAAGVVAYAVESR